MAKHRVFVIAADVKKGFEEPLRAHLAILNRALEGANVAAKYGYVGPTLRFSDIETLHYASFVVFDGAKLGGKTAKLVFECNIDGPAKPFLTRVLDDPAIDKIYEHCVDYPAGGSLADRLEYLRARIKKPQLFHIGAPYRSATSIKCDRDLRNRLDQGLDPLVNKSLSAYRARTPSGMREYWRWEILKPWLAWLIAAVVPGAAVGLTIVAWFRLSWFSAFVSTVVCVGVGLIGSVAARKLWVTALPDLRDRVEPWLRWALAALVFGAVSWRLWALHRRWAYGLIAVFLLLAAQSAWASVWRRWNERLLELRTNSTYPVVELWRVLQQQAIHVRDRSELFTRIVNWLPWPAAYFVIYVPVRLLNNNRWALVAVFTGLLLAKTLWLGTLLGWPAERNTRIPQDTARIKVFIAGVTVAGFAGLVVLTELRCPPALLAAIVLAAFFTLWSMPLPSPKLSGAFPKPDPHDLDIVTAQEDRDAQNHMAAVVPLRQDFRRLRVWALKSFLWILNRFYFRSLLPDWFRGKLWGLPTVQFAQWVLIDSRNYLFLSNYDNSWTAYLDDFGEYVTTGVQKIWGQGQSNPGTKDLGRFKDYARSTMVTHSLWYRAYPGLTLRQVWNNQEIRRGLAAAREEEAMVRTLRRLGAAPKVLPDAQHGRVL